MPVGFIDYERTRILLLNFARITEPELLLREIEEARRFVAAQPRRKELLVLVDLRGLRFNDEVLKAFSELTHHNEPYDRAAAVCGFSKIGRVAFRAQNLMTGGRLVPFETPRGGPRLARAAGASVEPRALA
jgi:hypothetical protein